MNLKQAARRLGVHYQTAYRWVRAGRLAAVRVGNGYEISEQAIAQLLAEADAIRRHSVDCPRAETEVPSNADGLLLAARGAYSSMALSPRAVFDVVCDGLGRVLGDLVVIRVLDGDALKVRAVHHNDPRRLSIAWTGIEMYACMNNEQHERVAITTRKPVLIRHLPQDQLWARTPLELIQFLDDARPHSLITVPACWGGEVQAVITLTREFPSRPFAPEDVALVSRLAAIVGATVVRSAEAQDAWRRRRALMNSVAECDGDVDDVEHLMSKDDTAELICSIDGRILCANQAAGDLGAVTPEQLVGLEIESLPVAEERSGERALLARLTTGELTFADNLRTVQADDGTLKYLTVHRGIVRNEAAEPTALVVIANQIPEPEPCPGSFAATG